MKMPVTRRLNGIPSGRYACLSIEAVKCRQASHRGSFELSEVEEYPNRGRNLGSEVKWRTDGVVDYNDILKASSPPCRLLGPHQLRDSKYHKAPFRGPSCCGRRDHKIEEYDPEQQPLRALHHASGAEELLTMDSRRTNPRPAIISFEDEKRAFKTGQTESEKELHEFRRQKGYLQNPHKKSLKCNGSSYFGRIHVP